MDCKLLNDSKAETFTQQSSTCSGAAFVNAALSFILSEEATGFECLWRNSTIFVAGFMEFGVCWVSEGLELGAFTIPYYQESKTASIAGVDNVLLGTTGVA